jgi:ParB-like chromosome segregation protein Spo0J
VSTLFAASATESIIEQARAVFEQLNAYDLDTRVEVLNALRRELHLYSPFANEPVDCIQWVRSESISANDYNPNSVAPPEMRLLERSISEDGYTQPIVSWVNGETYEVVDGFHRNRVGRECASVRERVHGYLPLTVINDTRLDRGDRIAATIRHNRARGKHQIAAMSDIVVELKRRNWTDEKIGRELGMEPDEVLRLTQITGLADMFADHEFSQSWETDGFEEQDVVLEDAVEVDE